MVVIRRLGANDARAFRALRLRGLGEFPPAFAESHDEFATKPESTIAEMLDDSAGLRHVFGAFTDAGELVGIVGVTGSLFLILYVTFLGSEEPFYEFMRRYGVYMYFALNVIALLGLVGTLKLRAKTSPD